MQTIPRLLFCLILLGLIGCAGRSLPDYERPLPRADVQKIRTTAYTHTEKDHRKYGSRNALGTPLRSGSINSAAADWSRWPVGTVFQIVATGEVYEVDDYGWALAGRNTIDLYKPNHAAMKEWGVRRVTLHILEWGDLNKSRRILEPRRKHKHVRRMLAQIDDQL